MKRCFLVGRFSSDMVSRRPWSDEPARGDSDRKHRCRVAARARVAAASSASRDENAVTRLHLLRGGTRTARANPCANRIPPGTLAGGAAGPPGRPPADARKITVQPAAGPDRKPETVS